MKCILCEQRLEASEVILERWTMDTMLAGTVIKKSCMQHRSYFGGHAYYALRNLWLLSAILLDAQCCAHKQSNFRRHLSASACMVFIMVSVGNIFHTNILSLKVKMLTVLCEWDNQGRPSPLSQWCICPGFRFPSVFPKKFLSPWENFPNFIFSPFLEKFISPIF